jgi:hypothetical protein
MTEPHPELGEQVWYYDPSLTRKAGMTGGWGTPGMRSGPYLAYVVNPAPGPTLQVHVCIPDSPPFPKTLRHKDETASPNDPYWTWKNELQRARAIKREKDAA